MRLVTIVALVVYDLGMLIIILSSISLTFLSSSSHLRRHRELATQGIAPRRNAESVLQISLFWMHDRWSAYKVLFFIVCLVISHVVRLSLTVGQNEIAVLITLTAINARMYALTHKVCLY